MDVVDWILVIILLFFTNLLTYTFTSSSYKSDICAMKNGTRVEGKCLDIKEIK